MPSLLAFQSDDPSLNPVNVYPTSAHRCSLEGAFTIFLSLEAFFEAFHLNVNTIFTYSNGLAYLDVKKLVLQTIKIMFSYTKPQPDYSLSAALKSG